MTSPAQQPPAPTSIIPAAPADDGFAGLQILRGPVRLRTLVTLRWLAVAGQSAAIAFVHFWLGFPLELGLCLSVIAASVWINAFSYLRFSRQHFLSDREALQFIAFDIVQLCTLLGVTGGLINPFAVLILAPVTIAASVLPLRLSMLIGGLAILGISVIGIYHLPLPWPDDRALVMPRIFTLGVWTALTLAVAFFTIYAHRVAAEASEMKSALAATQLVLAREEQLAAIGGLAAAAAHELGTPLATIQVTAKEMARDLEGQGLLEEDARLLVSQAERCRDILGRLSNLEADRDHMLDELDIGLLLREAAEPFAEQVVGPAVIFEMIGAPADAPSPIIRRRPELIYGLRNFIENAAAYARSKVLIEARWSDAQLIVSIHDDGPGFAPDILSRLGEPYVGQRMRGAKRGLGLGFFIAKTLLERSQARINFDNRYWKDGATRGAWVEIVWPRGAIEAIKP